MNNDIVQHHVRRIAIDILQAGNYLEAGRKAKAIDNLTKNVTSLRAIVKELKKSKR